MMITQNGTFAKKKNGKFFFHFLWAKTIVFLLKIRCFLASQKNCILKVFVFDRYVHSVHKLCTASTDDTQVNVYVHVVYKLEHTVYMPACKRVHGYANARIHAYASANMNMLMHEYMYSCVYVHI